MKNILRCISALIILALLISCCCVSEGNPPRFEFILEDYIMTEPSARVELYAQLKNRYSVGEDGETFELRDETGRVLAAQRFTWDRTERAFVINVPSDYTDKHLLTIYRQGESEPLSEAIPLFIRTELLPVKSFVPDGNQIAVTVICAAGGDYSAGIWLDLLDKYGAKATFFCSGMWAEEHPESVRRMYESGHDIGSHAYYHRHFTQLGYLEIKSDLDRTRDIISEITGGYQTTLFRAPFEEWSYTMNILCRDLGYDMIHFSVDSHDWESGIEEEAVFSYSTSSRLKSGGIVQFHSSSSASLKAADSILDYYVNVLGMELVTVSSFMPVNVN